MVEVPQTVKKEVEKTQTFGSNTEGDQEKTVDPKVVLEKIDEQINIKTKRSKTKSRSPSRHRHRSNKDSKRHRRSRSRSRSRGRRHRQRSSRSRSRSRSPKRHRTKSSRQQSRDRKSCKEERYSSGQKQSPTQTIPSASTPPLNNDNILEMVQISDLKKVIDETVVVCLSFTNVNHS